MIWNTPDEVKMYFIARIILVSADGRWFGRQGGSAGRAPDGGGGGRAAQEARQEMKVTRQKTEDL